MAFVVVYDACVLHPSTLRDLLIRIAQSDNLRDFPAKTLDQWGIEAKSADDFVLGQLHLDAPSIYVAVQQIADAWRNPPGTSADVLDRLERNGLVASVAFLRS